MNLNSGSDNDSASDGENSLLNQGGPGSKQRRDSDYSNYEQLSQSMEGWSISGSERVDGTEEDDDEITEDDDY